jgi:hypothetical protein
MSSITNKNEKALASMLVFLCMVFTHRIFFVLLELAAIAACDLVGLRPIFLIRFPSDSLATSHGLNILVLKGSITQLEGTGVFSDLTGKDIPGGGTGIDAGAGKSAGHVGGV